MFARLAAVVVFLLPEASLLHAGQVEPVQSGDRRNPRTQPLTVADALFSIPDVTGRMQLAGDLDGDGRRDLVAERGGGWGIPHRIDSVSTLDGHTIRTLWSSREGGLAIDWDVAGDVDGDGVCDLLVSQARGHSVRIVSGIDRTEIGGANGFPRDVQDARSVAYLDDLDGDGHCEYAVGSSQGDAENGRLTLANNLKRTFVLPGQVAAYSGREGRLLWHHEARSGHGFGVRMRSVGDVDDDGYTDLLVGPDCLSEEPLRLLSGKDGRSLGTLPNNGGPFGAAGDVDGDGNADIFLDSMHENGGDHSGSTSIVSTDGLTLLELISPDWASPYSTTTALGDVDGDGVPDFLLGEPNFHIAVPVDSGQEEYDLRSLPLEDAIELESKPWDSSSWESGAAWVYSGRTKRVILGAWRLPGSQDGMGLAGAPIPDITGDGFPEIAICDSNGAHVFAGPGPDPLHERK